MGGLGGFGWLGVPPCAPPSPAVLGVGAAVGDAAHGVVPAEKESGGGGRGVRGVWRGEGALLGRGRWSRGLVGAERFGGDAGVGLGGVGVWGISGLGDWGG